jgi:hypothetical protein
MGATLLVSNGRHTPVKRGPPERPLPPATRHALMCRATGAWWYQGCLERTVALCMLGLFSLQRLVCPRTMTPPSAEGVVL